MRNQIIAGLAAAAALCAGAALAEPYTDYTPQKGLWHVVTVKVDVSHIDDYVTSLKKVWAPGEELAKKHGLIDSYMILVKLNPEDGHGNVMLVEHFVSTAVLDPDQARDQALQRESDAAVSKATADAAVQGFDKYRTFVGDDYWDEMVFTK
jgi:hypothetical protein